MSVEVQKPLTLVSFQPTPSKIFWEQRPLICPPVGNSFGTVVIDKKLFHVTPEQELASLLFIIQTDQDATDINGSPYIERFLTNFFAHEEDVSNRIRIARIIRLLLEAHRGQRREDGNPYVWHLISVADILLEKKDEINSLLNFQINDSLVDTDLIEMALGHDFTEDTMVNAGYIKRRFGPVHARVITSVSEDEYLSSNRGEFKEVCMYRGKKILKGGLRAVLVKLADRLHNMRTLGSMPIEKRYRKAADTEWVELQLARGVGLDENPNSFYYELMRLIMSNLPQSEVALRYNRKAHLAAEMDAFRESLFATHPHFLALDVRKPNPRRTING